MKVHLWIEAAGCPTVCKHCWAQGTPYSAMPIDDLSWVLTQTKEWCEDHEIQFGSFPMHELMAHPDVAPMLGVYRDVLGYDPGFDPLATTGFPVADRDDWEETVTSIGAQGTRNFWLAFHGYRDGHDRHVAMPGAYEKTCQAARNVRTVGIGVGANVFLTTNVLANLNVLIDTIHDLELVNTYWSPAIFYPTARSRQYERERPTLDDLLPIASKVKPLHGFQDGFWDNLERHTEAAWIQKALSGEWQDSPARSDEVNVVCRPNFDLFTGWPGCFDKCHGNLKSVGIASVLSRALEYGAKSWDDLYGFPDSPLVSVLAERFGDNQNKQIHPIAQSIRYRWLDRMAGRA